MQTINIHDVSSIKLSDKSSNRRAFNVRTLDIIDAYGHKIVIELFAHDPQALTINADWNQDQAITV